MRCFLGRRDSHWRGDGVHPERSSGLGLKRTSQSRIAVMAENLLSLYRVIKARRADRQTSAQPGRAGLSIIMILSAVGAAPCMLSFAKPRYAYESIPIPIIMFTRSITPKTPHTFAGANTTRKMTLEEEFLALLKKAGVSYDPTHLLG